MALNLKKKRKKRSRSSNQHCKWSIENFLTIFFALLWIYPNAHSRKKSFQKCQVFREMPYLWVNSHEQVNSWHNLVIDLVKWRECFLHQTDEDVCEEKSSVWSTQRREWCGVKAGWFDHTEKGTLRCYPYTIEKRKKRYEHTSRRIEFNCTLDLRIRGKILSTHSGKKDEGGRHFF